MSLTRVEYHDEQSGVVSIGKSSKQKSCNVINVIFPHPFKVTPIVHLTPLNDHKDEDFTFATAILTTTRTGFCAIVRRVSNRMVQRGWSSSVKTYWFASVPHAFNGQITIGPSVVNNISANSLLGRQVLGSNQDYFATVTVNIPLTIEQQKNSPSPNVILTMHAGDSSFDDTFIATVREIYPTRFVAIVRKIHYDEPTRTWSHPLKLNWTAVFPNNSGSEFLKCKTIPVGDNSHDEDCIKRDIIFMHKPPKMLQSNSSELPIPTSVTVSARSDPTRPSNETFCFTVQEVTGVGFRLLIRSVSPVSWSRGWSQNLYVTYLAHYGDECRTKKKRKLVLSPSTENLAQSVKSPSTSVGEAVFIMNSANGLVLDITEFKKFTKVQLWTQKLFLVSQNQRFIFTDDGYIELASERSFVLECKGSSTGQELVINNKQRDNELQKWVVYKPATTSSDNQADICIASSANLSLVLDCDNDADENKEMNDHQSAKGTNVFVSEFSATRKSQLWQLKESRLF
jgi:hypothetical protein